MIDDRSTKTSRVASWSVEVRSSMVQGSERGKHPPEPADEFAGQRCQQALWKTMVL